MKAAHTAELIPHACLSLSGQRGSANAPNGAETLKDLWAVNLCSPQVKQGAVYLGFIVTVFVACAAGTEIFIFALGMQPEREGGFLGAECH